MPTILRVSEEGIFRFRDGNANSGDKVSNFTIISLKATVDVERDAGGSGFLVHIIRLADDVEK